MSTPRRKDNLTGSDANTAVEQLQETNIEQLQVSQCRRPPSEWNYPDPSFASSRSVASAPAQEISRDRLLETIIYFPDHVPVLPLLDFTQFELSPGHFSLNTEGGDADHPETEVDRTLGRKKSWIREKMTWDATGFASEYARSCFYKGPGQESTQHRQWSKGSNEISTNDHASTLRQQEIATPNATSANCTVSTINLHPSIPQPVYGASSDKVANTARDDGSKKRSDLLLLHELSPMSPSTASLPTGKSNPKQKKKAQKAAIKTAVTLFSNERIFIHWIKFGVLLGSLAMTLLNFSGEDVLQKVDQSLANRAENIGQAVGVSLMVICLLCLVYASLIFHWRHLGVVRSKSDDRYFDRIGPTLLTLTLLITYSINIILTIQISSNMDPNYQPSVFYNEHPDNTSTPMTPPLVTHTPTSDTPPLPPGFTFLVDDNDDVDDVDEYDM